MHSSKETVTIGWCDPGHVDGRFVDGLTATIMHCFGKDINLVNKIRVTGNQIGRQRQALFDQWADVIKSDWLLWVDSDIVLTPQVFEILWETADKVKAPVVSGLYFISKENEQSLMEPYPAAFNLTEDENSLEILHPVPENEVVKIDAAGFGIVMMHKSIIEKMRSVSPDYSLFAEVEKAGDGYISEDIIFFKKMSQAGIPLYINTSAKVQHMKRFSFDDNYYNLYWNSVQSGALFKNSSALIKSENKEE